MLRWDPENAYVSCLFLSFEGENELVWQLRDVLLSVENDLTSQVVYCCEFVDNRAVFYAYIPCCSVVLIAMFIAAL